MNEPHDPNRTVDEPSVPADSLDAGLAAGFGRPATVPRSSLGAMRPVLLPEVEGESAHPVKPQSDAMPPPEETGDRYQLSGEIARGGMGAVLRGRDVDLGRDLAVKVLLEKYLDRPEVMRRFIEEAQIGGQLQHPGVVPVYDIGRFGDRPFFTMKLVKGLTLVAILGERDDPAADRPRLLSIGLQVAQALAYSHAKGVIHRDIKPANVMVGAFGEVQVMDWGLAKVLTEGDHADKDMAHRQHQPEAGTLIRTARSSGTAGSGSDTEAGSLMGTPAYMPPEQANGDVANLDRRADVFGLGAILCEMLTGKPPYVGRTAEEVRRKAANGDLADATALLDASGADQELIALTKRCLAPEAIDRPKDAQAVADGLTAYLNGVQKRLQTAERERAVAVAREAEQRKRRRVQLALAAAVVGLLLGGGSFAWWRNEQAQLVRQREGRNAEAVTALLDQCEEALRADDAAKAAVVLEAARKRSVEGGAEEQVERLGRLAAELALLHDLDDTDQFRLTVAENKLPDPAVVATRTREALTRFGADPEAVSVGEAAALVSASVVRERIVNALDRLLMGQMSAGVRAVLGLVDADPYRDAVRNAILANDGAKFVELAGQKGALEQPPGFAAFLGDSGVIGVERRRQLLESAVSRRSGNLGLLMTLAGTYKVDDKDGVNERLRWYQAAVAAAPANYAANNNLGNALAGKGQVDEAIACFKKAIALEPKLAGAHTNLGLALKDKGEWDEAIASLEKAIALEPKSAAAHTNLGVVLKEKGQVDEAIACYQKAIALKPKFAEAHNNLGNALKAKSQVDEAIACYKKAIALDPKSAVAHNNLGGALYEKGQLDEAISWFRKAIALEPKFADAQCNLGIALRDKGQALLGKGRYAVARDASAQALALLPVNHPLRALATQQLQECGRLLKLEARLPGLLWGEDQPASARESLDLAQMCAQKKMNAAAARFWDTAFAREEKLADDLQAGHRYKAACYAALAAAGQGVDAAKLDDKERTRLRKQALDWLRADLAAYVNLLEAAGSLLEQVREAVQAKRIPKSQVMGTGQDDYEEVPKGGALLIGFEVTYGKFGDNPTVITLRPIFLTRDGRVMGTTHGIQGEGLTRVEAKPGYAVGAVTIKAGLGVDGMSVRFMEIGDKGLNPNRAYESEWLGGMGGGPKMKLAGSGAPVVGIFGATAAGTSTFNGLGLVTADGAVRARAALAHWQKDSDLAGIRDKAALDKLPPEEQKAFTQLWTDVTALLKKAEDKGK